jgi:hypothetical protein
MNAGTCSTGVECAEFSNVTFTAVPGGSLTAEAGTSGSGIGTAAIQASDGACIKIKHFVGQAREGWLCRAITGHSLEFLTPAETACPCCCL